MIIEIAYVEQSGLGPWQKISKTELIKRATSYIVAYRKDPQFIQDIIRASERWDTGLRISPYVFARIKI